MTRFDFIRSSIAFAGAMAMPEGLFAGTGRPDLRVGISSDIHVENEKDCELLRKAFLYFREQGVDAVAIPGDFTNYGTIEELELVARVWNEVFPADIGKDGRKVEKLFVCGNHDMEGAWYGKVTKEKWPDWEERKKHIFLYHMEETWPRLFGEPWAPIWTKTVKGFTFIGAHWKNASRVEDPWGWHGVPDIVPFMDKLGPRLRKDRPFFLIQHHHPNGTCLGERAWGRDDGYATRALSPYPNAVALSGHSHMPLTDETSVWQGSFTSVNCGSLRYAGLPAGRDNANGEAKASFSRMGGVDTRASHQILIMDVWKSRVAFHRRELNWNQRLGPAWVVPVPVGKSPAFSFSRRAKAFAPPEFAAGAAIEVKRDGDSLKISFPAAGTSEVRVFEYEIRFVEPRMDFIRVLREKRVFSGDAPFPPERRVSEECVDAGIGTDVPSRGQIRIEVTPLDSFGNRGRTLACDFNLNG